MWPCVAKAIHPFPKVKKKGGFLQKEGFDYIEVFSSVARHETIILVIAVETSKSCPLYHLDVESAFLNGTLEETVYITQPHGFTIKGK